MQQGRENSDGAIYEPSYESNDLYNPKSDDPNDRSVSSGLPDFSDHIRQFTLRGFLRIIQSFDRLRKATERTLDLHHNSQEWQRRCFKWGWVLLPRCYHVEV